MPITGYATIAGTDNMGSLASRYQDLGTKIQTKDGREFIWAKAGGSNLVAGTLQSSPAIVANHNNISVAATNIGATEVTVTLGATAATANQYAKGLLMVVDGTGEGHSYSIKGHPAAASAADLVLKLDEPIRVALVAGATSEVTLYPNPYNGTVIYPTTPVGAAVGWATTVVTAGEYYWCQTRGPLAALMDGTPAIGSGLSPSNATAGAVEIHVLAQGFVGNAIQLGVSTEQRGVFAMIS